MTNPETPAPDADGAAPAKPEQDRMPAIIAIAGVLCVVVPIFTLPLAPLLVWASIRCLRTRRPGNPWLYVTGAVGGAIGVVVSVWGILQLWG